MSRPNPIPLTPRQQEVLDLIATGLENKEIAATLFLADGTVRNHVRHLLAKFNVANRVKLVVKALELGQISSIKKQGDAKP